MSHSSGIPKQIIRNDYSSTNVTTGAYVELDASIDGDILEVEIFDSSGQTMVLALGAASAEDDMIYIMPGGNGRISLIINKLQRLSVKAVSGNATSGELTMNLWG